MASREMQIGVGLVVLAGLGAAVYFQQKKDAAKGTAVAAAELPTFKGTDDVDKIDLVTSKGEVVLEKKGEKWELTKPVSAPANQTNVKSLLDNLKEVKLDRVTAKNPDDAVKISYELDKEHSLHLVTFKGGEKKLDATFGKSGSDGNAVMLEGKTDVFIAKGYTGFLYARPASDYRDKEMFKFDDANVTGMVLTNKNGTFDLSKAGSSWTGKIKDKAIERFDEEKAKSLVGALKALSAEDFGDGKAPADTGLDAPEATITVALKDGSHTLKIGKASSGPSRYALRDSDSTIFVIGSSVGEWATADASKLQKPLDGGAAKEDGPPGGMDMPPGMMPPGMQLPPGMRMPHGHP